MYEHFYGYRSGINATMRNHLRSYNDRLQEFARLQPGDSVLDIGSNDCTFLGRYPADTKKFGCDPTGTQFSEFYKETSVTLVPTYFTKGAIQTALGPTTRFKAVSSISMFYDLPDPIQFARDIYDLLDDNGVWTLEQSYVATMLGRNSIDTICHEHLEFYCLKQIQFMAKKVGFKIIDVEFNNVNGGSFSITVQKTAKPEEILPQINAILQKEIDHGYDALNLFSDFASRTKSAKETLLNFLAIAKKENKVVAALGASTKGNVLLQYCGLTQDDITCVGEVNDEKFSCYTPGSWLPIVPENELLALKPDYLIILPWHFKSFFIGNAKFSGCKLVFPLPTLEVVEQ
jgi:hypothetical protein